jgi:hypothetical protein
MQVRLRAPDMVKRVRPHRREQPLLILSCGLTSAGWYAEAAGLRIERDSRVYRNSVAGAEGQMSRSHKSMIQAREKPEQCVGNGLDLHVPELTESSGGAGGAREQGVNEQGQRRVVHKEEVGNGRTT